jgi:hypothetical protein
MSAKTRTASSTPPVSVCPAAKSQQPPYGAVRMTGRKNTAGTGTRPCSSCCSGILAHHHAHYCCQTAARSPGAEPTSRRDRVTWRPPGALRGVRHDGFCRPPAEHLRGRRRPRRHSDSAQTGRKMVYDFLSEHSVRGEADRGDQWHGPQVASVAGLPSTAKRS